MSEELELVIEVGESGFFADFFLEFVDWAGGVDGFDRSTFGADEVVAMLIR